MRTPALVTLALCVGCGRAPLPEIRTSASKTSAPSAAECVAGQPPPDTPVFRLSVREYVNTLSDLFSDKPGLYELMQAASLGIAQLPPDGESDASFSQMDRRISQRHVDTYLQVAEAIGRAATESDARLSALAGGCALSRELDSACLDRFLGDFGRKVFRRPLTDKEKARLRAVSYTHLTLPTILRV